MVHHLSLHVRDIERTLDFYNRMGFETVFSLDMPDGCYICWVQDPDGNWIEVMEALDCSLQENFEKVNPF